MRRLVRLAAAALLLTSAAVLVLLATDVRSWQATMAADDLVYRGSPARRGLWQTEERAPSHAARRLLGLRDDLAYRDAARLYRLGRPREEIFLSSQLAIIQAEAQGLLEQVAAEDEDPERVASADNLLGVLAFALARRDPALESTMIEEGFRRFREAVEHDPSNPELKFNLELALRTIQGREATNPQDRGGGRGRARGTASLGDEAGEGY